MKLLEIWEPYVDVAFDKSMEIFDQLNERWDRVEELYDQIEEIKKEIYALRAEIKNLPPMRCELNQNNINNN